MPSTNPRPLPVTIHSSGANLAMCAYMVEVMEKDDLVILPTCAGRGRANHGETCERHRKLSQLRAGSMAEIEASGITEVAEIDRRLRHHHAGYAHLVDRAPDQPIPVDLRWCQLPRDASPSDRLRLLAHFHHVMRPRACTGLQMQTLAEHRRSCHPCLQAWHDCLVGRSVVGLQIYGLPALAEIATRMTNQHLGTLRLTAAEQLVGA